MPAEKTDALVLRLIDFSETSTVVTLFTRDFGKLGALAKGGRRPKGPFEAALDLLARCRILFLRKSSDALDLLTEAKLLRRFRPAKGDLASLYAAYYVAELLVELTDEYDPHPQLFDLAVKVLDDLALGMPVDARILYFEMTALRLVGHAPLLDQCAECGGAVADTARFAFGLLDGGLLCSSCRVKKKQVVLVSSAAIAQLKLSAHSTFRDAPSEQFDRSVNGELRAVVNRYISHLVGHKLKMHRFLGTVVG